jgi:hypothetical protein
MGTCNNCGDCYDCLTSEQLEVKYNEIIKIPLVSRMFKCNCFMCRNPRTANCYELEYFFKNNTLGVADISYIINRINKDKKEVRKRIFKRYLKCLIRFLYIFYKTLEKTYSPGGRGFLRTKEHFYSIKSSMFS